MQKGSDLQRNEAQRGCVAVCIPYFFWRVMDMFKLILYIRILNIKLICTQRCRFRQVPRYWRRSKRAKQPLHYRRSTGVTLHHREQIRLFLEAYYTPAFNMQQSKRENDEELRGSMAKKSCRDRLRKRCGGKMKIWLIRPYLAKKKLLQLN